MPLPEKERLILFNGLYGAVDLLLPGEAEIMERAMTAPAALEGLASVRRETFIRRGHLVIPGQEDGDLDTICRSHRTAKGGVGLVLAPTYDCNLRCSYCFERHRLEHGPDWLDRIMSRETLDSIFAQMKDYKSKGYSAGRCLLYGGEPLLPSTKALIREIFERCGELGMPVGAVTNGYNLDGFLEFPFSSLQITVDGVEEIHDRRRPLAGGGGSFERIMRNIGLALARGLPVTLRVNIGRSNLSSLTELPAEFRARGFTGGPASQARAVSYVLLTTAEGSKPTRGEFSYYFKAAFDSGADEITDEEIFEELLKTGCAMEEAIRLEGAYSSVAARLAGWLDKRRFPTLNPTYCGAENGMNVIGPDGLIYPCWNLVARDDEAIGFAEEGRFLYGFGMGRWRARTADRMEPCRKCPLIMVCGGGCAAEPGTGFLTGNCGEMKTIFATVAPWLFSRAWKEGPDSQSCAVSDLIREGMFRHRDSEQMRREQGADSPPVNSMDTDDARCLTLSAREFLSTTGRSESL